MNTPTMTTKGEQAKNQLIAAALAQFGEYGLHATTRDIAAQAGQNIAAITYYFGSKEDLYLACAQWIADFIGSQFRPHAEEAERLFAQPEPDRGAMRELILRACKNMIMLLTQDDTVNLSKFISREQLSHRGLSTGARPGYQSATYSPDAPDCCLYRRRCQRYPNDPAHPRPTRRGTGLSSGERNHSVAYGLVTI